MDTLLTIGGWALLGYLGLIVAGWIMTFLVGLIMAVLGLVGLMTTTTKED